MPAIYKDMFYLLYRNKIISRATYENMRKLIYFRNLISHRYHRITAGELYEMLGLLKIVEKFTEACKENYQ